MKQLCFLFLLATSALHAQENPDAWMQLEGTLEGFGVGQHYFTLVTDGYPSGNNLLFWQENNQLSKVLETSSVSEGGLFYDMEEYILPSQRGGIGDHVLVTRDHSAYEEKGDEMVRSKQTFGVVLFKWTGSKLLKGKEIK